MPEGMPSAAPKNESPERLFGDIQSGPESSEQFPGKQIFSFKQGGEYVYYAVGRTSSGQIEGTQFTLSENEDGRWKNSASLAGLDKGISTIRVNAGYQMHAPDIEKMEKILSSKGIQII